MKKITLKLYSFNELDKGAKEKALTTYRDFNVEFNWWDDEFEDFMMLCATLGIAVDKDSIKFSGFYAQGDGSGFSAQVNIPQLDEAIKTKAWQSYAPLQEFPFAPSGVDRRVMALLEKNILPNEPQIISRTRYYDVVTDLGIYVVNEKSREHNNVFDELEKLEAWLRNIARTLNKYLYNILEKQYEFLTGDQAVKESILNNEYLFTADGRSASHLVKLTQNEH